MLSLLEWKQSWFPKCALLKNETMDKVQKKGEDYVKKGSVCDLV